MRNGNQITVSPIGEMIDLQSSTIGASSDSNGAIEQHLASVSQFLATSSIPTSNTASI
jgi:hypothetical protein